MSNSTGKVLAEWHSDVTTTLGIYAHSMSEDRLAAKDEMRAAMMTPSNAVN